MSQPENRRPVGWSMDLLNQIRRDAAEPEYAASAANGEPPRRTPWALALAVAVIGVIIALQGTVTVRGAPDAAVERRGLITRIQSANTRNAELNAEQERVAAEIRALQNAGGSDTSSRLDAIEPVVGARAVTGPGLVVVVDDADGNKPSGRVADADLRRLVNGLWEAGAEAIAVNGIRLTARSAIRGAGSAITVDYRSLTRPYRVDAIGDPKTLQARLVSSPGGVWWQGLRDNYGFRYDISQSPNLRLPGNAGLTVRYVKEGG